MPRAKKREINKITLSFFRTTYLVAFIFLLSIALSLTAYGKPLNLSDATVQLGTAAGEAGYQTSNDSGRLETAVGQIIKAFLSFLGIIFLILVIYGGFTWMTAQGNEEKVTKARKTIIEASLGLAVVLAAYVITYYIVDKLLVATLGG